MTLWQLATVANEIRSTRDEYMILQNWIGSRRPFQVHTCNFDEVLVDGVFYARQQRTFHAISFLCTRKLESM